MSASFDPSPRPALRKAPDADVHPTTHVARSSLSNASDSVLGGKEVELTVLIPKKLRKQVKKVVRDSDLSMDQLVTIALAAEVQRRNS